MAKVTIPTLKLNNGLNIPALGYGTWLGLNEKSEFDTTDGPKFIEALSYAIDIGYRHIDTAHLYRVEPEVGQVINKKIKDGVVKREELFVTTKVWHHYHREADVEVSARASLRRLNLDYLDLVLMHWPMSISEDGVDEKIDYLETWRGFETVLDKGLAKSIGVSNFNVQQLKRLVANCKVVPATNQLEVNLNLGEREVVDYCKTQSIVVVAYTPFGSIVPSRRAPDSPAPALDDPTMVAMAEKYGKSVTQVILRYLYQRGLASIPKTVTKSRVLENASIFDFEIDAADSETLSKFDVGYRSVRLPFWQKYTNYPFENIPCDDEQEIPLALRKWKDGLSLNVE